MRSIATQVLYTHAAGAPGEFDLMNLATLAVCGAGYLVNDDAGTAAIVFQLLPPLAR